MINLHSSFLFLYRIIIGATKPYTHSTFCAHLPIQININPTCPGVNLGEELISY